MKRLFASTLLVLGSLGLVSQSGLAAELNCRNNEASWFSTILLPDHLRDDLTIPNYVARSRLGMLVHNYQWARVICESSGKDQIDCTGFWPFLKNQALEVAYLRAKKDPGSQKVTATFRTSSLYGSRLITMTCQSKGR